MEELIWTDLIKIAEQKDDVQNVWLTIDDDKDIVTLLSTGRISVPYVDTSYSFRPSARAMIMIPADMFEKGNPGAKVLSINMDELLKNNMEKWYLYIYGYATPAGMDWMLLERILELYFAQHKDLISEKHIDFTNEYAFSVWVDRNPYPDQINNMTGLLKYIKWWGTKNDIQMDMNLVKSCVTKVITEYSDWYTVSHKRIVVRNGALKVPPGSTLYVSKLYVHGTPEQVKQDLPWLHIRAIDRFLSTQAKLNQKSKPVRL